MRMTRTLATFVAIVASLALGLTLAPANAQRDAEAQAGITLKVKVKNARTLKASGVASNWKRKAVQVQVARKGTTQWKTADTDVTDGRGNFVAFVKAGSDIPCTGKAFKIRAKKKGRPSVKVFPRTFSCG